MVAKVFLNDNLRMVFITQFYQDKISFGYLKFMILI